MTQRIRFAAFVLACMLLPQMAAAGMGMMYLSDPRNIKGADMAMHHMHILMNRGMTMVLRGANLVTTAQMGMSPETDTAELRHGEKMIDTGKSLIQAMLSSQTMRKLHLSEHGGDKLMLYTHKLGDAMQAVVQASGKNTKAEASGRGKENITLSHVHLMVNRALMLSLEGSSLVMFGQMDMVRGMDRIAIKHGRSMMSMAHTQWQEAIQGKAMNTRHEHGVDAIANMKYTHRHANAAKRVMDMLDGMSKVKAAKTNFRSSYNRY